MKRYLTLLILCLFSLAGFAQKFTEDDAKQFYRTLQGDYTAQLNDSVSLKLHLTPIWEREDDPFHWLYLEVNNPETQEIVEQKILEVRPSSDISFKIIVHGISHPEQFAGKWSNRNFFDGFNTSILKGKSKFKFLKTKNFEYQTDWSGRKSFKCFPPRDRVHFKCSQEDERICIKRVPSGTSNIIGITFFKDPTD